MPHEQTTTYEVLRARAVEAGDRPALLADRKSPSTYSGLDALIQSRRRELAAFGINRGNRVGIFLRSRDAAASSYLTVISFATAIPLASSATPYEVQAVLTRSMADALIVETGTDDSFIEAAYQAGCRTIVELTPSATRAADFTLNGDVTDPGAEPIDPRPEDVMVILQTSGTTAEPKVVPLTQGSRAFELSLVRGEMKPTPADRVLAALPLHHGQGLGAEVFIPIAFGASVAIVEFNPETFVDSLRSWSATIFTLAPSLHQAVIASNPDGNAVLRDSKVRYARSATAALSADLRRTLEEFYGVPVLNNYASTEGGLIAREDVPEHERRDGSVGRALHAGVQIMDSDGRELPTGDVGEVWVRGPLVMAGYERNPEANDQAFHDEYFKTGDTGYFDEDGFLFVRGRVAESINRGGEIVSPVEVDEVLVMHSSVKEAAAFGTDHEKLGQEVAAAVVLQPGASMAARELRRFASERLSFEKVPKSIYFIDELPRGSTGKVQRNRLQHLVS